MIIVPIILAGGSGTRLWPLSRPDRPKQLLRLFGGKSLFTSPTLGDWGADWAPDGTRIAFASTRDSVNGQPRALFVMNVGGSNATRLTTGIYADINSSAAWSPDGSKIAYQEEGALFTVELGGGDVKKLTDQATNDSSPAWNPQPSPGDE